MTRIAKVAEVFDSIEAVKSGAPAFCTNFFPVQKKLQNWIEHGELFGESRDGTAFFLRQDRDLWHLYFSAADVPSLGQGLARLSVSSHETVVADLVGDEKAIGSMRTVLESAGFCPYARLLRMARLKQKETSIENETAPSIQAAAQSDVPAIMTLLEASFDYRADQLPTTYEIEAATAAQQIMVIKDQDKLAAMLHFETQGVTSTIRYWVVAEPFRARRWGSALMRQYLAIHAKVQRFLLWVVSENSDAIQKYAHFGYAPDGLVDHVLLRSK